MKRYVSGVPRQKRASGLGLVIGQAWLALFLANSGWLAVGCSASDGPAQDDDDDGDTADDDDDGDDDDSQSNSDDDDDGDDDDDSGTGSDSQDSSADDDDDDDDDDDGDDDDDDDTTDGGTGPSPEVIDDFADGDHLIYSENAEGRRGFWWVQTDGTANGKIEPKPGDTFKPAHEDSEQTYFGRIEGEAFEGWGAQLGFGFLLDDDDKNSIYETKHNALTFKVRGTGKVQVAYAVGPAASPAKGGTCPDPEPDKFCDDYHYVEFDLTNEWESHTILFDDPHFAQAWQGWGADFDAKKSLQLAFRTPPALKGEAFKIEVDDVAFADVDQEECTLAEGDGAAQSDAPHYPFPQNRAREALKPTHKCPELLAKDIVDLYESWKEKYLRSNSDGHYIEMQGECSGQTTITTSEAHGYGLIIVALMAGHDPEAKEIFDSMLGFVDANPSSVTPELMNGCVVADSDVANTATDGDFDYAYSLLLADAQWGGYADRASKVIAAIEGSPDLREGWLPSAGDWDTSADQSRSSDWMTSHFAHFAQVGNQSTWSDLRNLVYQVVETFTGDFAKDTGLVSDWIVGNPPEPGPENHLDEGELTDDYGYNACRFPWRVSMDFGHHGNAAAREILAPLLEFAKNYSHHNPNLFTAGITLGGEPIPGPDGDIYTDLPFTAPIVSAATTDPQYQTFVNIGWEVVVDWRGQNDHDYYADSLSLLNMLYISGNWWPPT